MFLLLRCSLGCLFRFRPGAAARAGHQPWCDAGERHGRVLPVRAPVQAAKRFQRDPHHADSAPRLVGASRHAAVCATANTPFSVMHSSLHKRTYMLGATVSWLKGDDIVLRRAQIDWWPCAKRKEPCQSLSRTASRGHSRTDRQFNGDSFACAFGPFRCLLASARGGY